MIIKALILKDFYEYKNNFLKFFGSLLGLITIPVVMFNFYGVSQIFLSDITKFTEVACIMFTTLILCETTVFQIHRNIRDGIFEKYFINMNIKKYQLLLSKYLSNLIVVFISFLLFFGLNSIMGMSVLNAIRIEISLSLILQLILVTGLATTIGFISSLLINDEKNAAIYTFSLFIIYVGFYKVLEILNLSGFLIEILGLTILLAILSLVVLFLLKKNRFIRR
jgi:hypothetical protein